MDFLKQYRAALKVGTPIVAIETVDPTSTMAAIMGCLTKPRPIIMWDRMRGLLNLNQEGREALNALGAEPSDMVSQHETLRMVIENAPARTLMFMLNPQFDKPEFRQSIWNSRDPFKGSKRQLVMLAPSFNLPADLVNDVMVMSQPLPNAEERKAIVLEAFNALDIKPSKQEISKAVDLTCGLGSFTIDTAMMMSGDPDSKVLDFTSLRDRRQTQISQVKGLSLYTGTECFDDITGLDNAKTYFTRRGKGRNPRRGVVIIDEIEKHMSGFGAHGTGDTTTEMVGAFLSEMSLIKAEGNLAVGVNGSGKTMLAQALGNEWDVPVLWLDFSGLKASHVGESGDNFRAAWKVVRAMTDDFPYVFGTSNNINILPPELRRRFFGPTFFFDLPNDKDRAAAWAFYMKKYKLTGKIPADQEWTPSEISNCCYQAYTLECSLIEAASFIVPTARSGAATIKQLREMADNTFISASYPGVYKMPKASLKRAVGE